MQGRGATSQAADQRALLPLLHSLLRVPCPLLRWSSSNCVIYCASRIVCCRCPILIRNDMPHHTYMSNRSPIVQKSGLPHDVCPRMFLYFLYPLLHSPFLSPSFAGLCPARSLLPREGRPADPTPFHVPPRQAFHPLFRTTTMRRWGGINQGISKFPFVRRRRTREDMRLEKTRGRRRSREKQETVRLDGGFPMTSQRQVTSLGGVRRPARGRVARCSRRGWLRIL